MDKPGSKSGFLHPRDSIVCVKKCAKGLSRSTLTFAAHLAVNNLVGGRGGVE